MIYSFSIVNSQMLSKVYLIGRVGERIKTKLQTVTIEYSFHVCNRMHTAVKMTEEEIKLLYNEYPVTG